MANLFFSYCHVDEELRNELEVHLAMLKRQGLITTWHDRRIVVGSEIDQDISQNLEDSDVILLLVSAHFLASNYCYEKEMVRALEKHELGEAKVIPVILHPCDWHHAPFGKLLATPTDGKPVSMFANQQEAFTIIAKQIRVAIEELPSSPIPKSVTSFISPQPPIKSESVALPRSSNMRLKQEFSDHDRDCFLETSFDYIARYFEGSLEELGNRNQQIQVRFKQITSTRFCAYIYENGSQKSVCNIWYGSGHFERNTICYSSSENDNSMNDWLSVENDGFSLYLKASGMNFYRTSDTEEQLTQQGAAEYFWSSFIHSLQ
ncbi:toll/interleukin-1 receptor domain-containing protein [Vibrio sp. SCSIO 43155]|uniref:toll/interleukin-1 receptor domain-containing protein n=1 Tax=Vibrio sp. SCSIO 43155 TaxID=2819099 RepID=UPI00207538A0|nr:toll/interleukin-1 receptor domain-containing protein [Vibrio sp. SCSIO 43155]USD55741.1 toll/interleukin-1 receptor domain-containing protein [Vibrio sp. SCSIO 43155]